MDQNIKLRNITKEREDFLNLLNSIKVVKENKLCKINCSESITFNTSSVEKESEKKISTGNEMQKTHQTSYSQTKHPEISDEERQDFLKINVYDKIKGIKKIFKCPRELSLKKIRYFRNKISFSSDIYVECDTKAFSWILRWLIKEKDLALNPELLPRVLEASYILDAPILLTTCLKFWRANIKHVVIDWETLDETVIIELANLFDNCSLEELTGKSSNLQEILYEKFIIFLNELKPRKNIGHFESLSTLFKCEFCGKFITEALESQECQFVLLESTGNSKWAHHPSHDWSLRDLISQLKEKHKDWRLVYWSLWLYSHYLYCSTCSNPFCLSDINRCVYHPKSSVKLSKKDFPTYLCCGEKKRKFETIWNQRGCQYKRHTPIFNTEKEKIVYKIFNFINRFITMENFIFKKNKIQMKGALDENDLAKKLSLINEEYFQLHKDNVTDQAKGTKQKKILKGCWQENSSIGLNQDSQRDLEERKMKIIQNFLSKSKDMNKY